MNPPQPYRILKIAHSGKIDEQNILYDYPVVTSPDGISYVCLMVIKGCMFTNRQIKWYVFGVVDNVKGESGDDFILYGYVHHVGKDLRRLGTFSYRNLLDLEAEVIYNAGEVTKECPPPGWTLQEGHNASILEDVH